MAHVLISFKNRNVGPMASGELTFARRLNVFTGDNSLGKSFLLDLLWYGLTRHWPHDLNPLLDGGYPARPTLIKEKAELTYRMQTMTGCDLAPFSIVYEKESKSWKSKPGRRPQPGLVIYAMADGSFAVWDPILNYWAGKGDDAQPKEPAFILSRAELWPSDAREHSRFCKGVIEGWSAWQRDKDERMFTRLKAVFEALAPSDEEMKVGELDTVPLADGGDQPTVNFGYGTVRLQHASSAVRRMASLAYVLTWAVSQHVAAAEDRGMEATHNIVVLFDEIEAHLHPRWQRSIVKGLRTAIPLVCDAAGLLKEELQLFLSTHSPLVMAALEDEFASSAPESNKWFDFDMNMSTRQVDVSESSFVPQGTAENWLRSSAFDLVSTYSPEVEQLVDEAERILDDADGREGVRDVKRLREIARTLAARLPQGDDLVFRLYDLLGEMPSQEETR